jgi:hypothetical protein
MISDNELSTAGADSVVSGKSPCIKRFRNVVSDGFSEFIDLHFAMELSNAEEAGIILGFKRSRSRKKSVVAKRREHFKAVKVKAAARGVEGHLQRMLLARLKP